MACVCCYFQIHQPFRLRRYNIFDTASDYFDEKRNGEICKRVTGKCYTPAGNLLFELIRRFQGEFRFGLSVTGSAIEQFRHYSPQVIDILRELTGTNCVEMLGETYYHSLAFLHSWPEFSQQVELHRKLMETTFNQHPTVFRGTELVYSNELARFAHNQGYKAILAEGADEPLGLRSCNVLYRPVGEVPIKVLLKNYRLSDDIAFRFSNRAWEQWPLTAEKFTSWVNQIDGHGDLCNLFIDFETFGEHQWADTGILDFLRYLPQTLLRSKHKFVTPGEAAAIFPANDTFDAPQPISWADTERDLSAWTGNAMQDYAMKELFKLEAPIKAANDPQLLADWRHLTTSDHFYYMSTKYFADGDVHKYFSPYESPYDSYINYMNVLDNISTRARGLG